MRDCVIVCGASVGNRLDFRNKSSVWPKQSMIDGVIGLWDAVSAAHGRWDEGVISAITPLGICCRLKFVKRRCLASPTLSHSL